MAKREAMFECLVEGCGKKFKGQPECQQLSKACQQLVKHAKVEGCGNKFKGQPECQQCVFVCVCVCVCLCV